MRRIKRGAKCSGQIIGSCREWFLTSGSQESLVGLILKDGSADTWKTFQKCSKFSSEGENTYVSYYYKKLITLFTA